MNLLKKLKNLADKVVYAETTLSEYYNIGSIKVRVSDHMSSSMDCDLAIFAAKDDKGKHYTYAVIPMVGTFKEVQWFTNANAVIEFILRFESIARLLIKSPTSNNNQKERVSLNLTNKIEEPSKLSQVNKNQVKFDLWKSKLGSLYIEKGGELQSLLNEIYHFSGTEEIMEYMLKYISNISHECKKLALEGLLLRVKNK